MTEASVAPAAGDGESSDVLRAARAPWHVDCLRAAAFCRTDFLVRCRDGLDHHCGLFINLPICFRSQSCHPT